MNVTNLVMKAFYEALNGNTSKPVYRIDAPPDEEGDYILIRPESMASRPNNHVFQSDVVIITEVVTKQATRANDEIATNLDTEIDNLILLSPRQQGLPAQAGIQVVHIDRRDATYLPEDDGTNRFVRLITRNVCRIVQT